MGNTPNTTSAGMVAILAPEPEPGSLDNHGHVIPTDEELETLPRIAGSLPWTAYLLCAVELAERASYYGCVQIFNNFIRAKLPKGGNGAGAPPRGTQETAGALGKGSVVTTAMSNSFTFLTYALPIFGGWLADAKLGRFKCICIGVFICGIAHIIMVVSVIPSILQAGLSIGPFAVSIYTLAVGTSLFKPNIAPTVLDQNPHRKAHVITTSNGSKAIVDPDVTSDSIMLWFYLVVNLGAFLAVATAYLAKDVGYWAAYSVPGLLYFMLPILLFIVNKRLVKLDPGGSALSDFIRVNFLALKKAGIRGIGRNGYWNRAMPSTLAAEGDTRTVGWTDNFVEDVRRTMMACGVFLFFPIQQINDYGLGAAANTLSSALTSNGLPNDVLININCFVIILLIPTMNHIIYPFLRNNLKIRFGPIARMTFGFLIAATGGAAYAIIMQYIYKTSPCGYYVTTPGRCPEGVVSHLSIWLSGIPVGVGAASEVFVNVTAYGIAYSRAPPNMRGFVMALSLCMTAISTAIGLVAADAIKDPYLVWDFAVPSVLGYISAFVFYWIFRDLDKEDFFVDFDDIGSITDRGSNDEEKTNSSLNERSAGMVAVREIKD